jgi:hypothetical protein
LIYSASRDRPYRLANGGADGATQKLPGDRANGLKNERGHQKPPRALARLKIRQFWKGKNVSQPTRPES